MVSEDPKDNRRKMASFPESITSIFTLMCAEYTVNSIQSIIDSPLELLFLFVKIIQTFHISMMPFFLKKSFNLF